MSSPRVQRDVLKAREVKYPVKGGPNRDLNLDLFDLKFLLFFFVMVLHCGKRKTDRQREKIQNLNKGGGKKSTC